MSAGRHFLQVVVVTDRTAVGSQEDGGDGRAAAARGGDASDRPTSRARGEAAECDEGTAAPLCLPLSAEGEGLQPLAPLPQEPGPSRRGRAGPPGRHRGPDPRGKLIADPQVTITAA